MRRMAKTTVGLKGLALAALALAGTGCSRHMMTPPSRIGEFETPTVLAKDEKSVTLSGGGNVGVFYTGAAAGSIQARKGLGDGREAGFDATLLKVGIGDEGRIADDASPYVLTINSRYKWNPTGAERWLSLFGGIGFGFSEPTVFSTFEGGFSLGWDNAYLVPYVGSKGTLDIPITSKYVDVRESKSEVDEGDAPEKAPLTVGAMSFAGLKLPFPFNGSPAKARPALIMEAQYSQFWTADFTPGFLGARMALQFPVRL